MSFEDQWFSETDSGCFGSTVMNRRLRPRRDDQRWNCKNKSGNRTGNADLEQRRAMLNRRTNLDESAHGSDERWSAGMKYGRRRRYPVISAREVVTHFVREQEFS